MSARIIEADCRDAMLEMDADSIDAIVTDPPYHLTTGKKGGSGRASENLDSPAGRSRATTGFMGKTWDGGGIAHDPALWAEALRIAKPGAHLLAFGGTRTFHRLACAIEDAGWEIRDCVMYLYGSGFPKSFNLDRKRGEVFCDCEQTPERSLHSVCDADVSQAVDPGERRGQVLQSGVQEQGAPAETLQCTAAAKGASEPCVEGRSDIPQAQRQLCIGEVSPSSRMGEADGAEGRLRHGTSARDGGMVRTHLDANGGGTSRQPRSARQQDGQPRIVARQPQSQAGGAWPVCGGCGKPRIPTGLGTALKPAWEPIIVARKPLRGTVAANVQQFGTGALNIDGCRIKFASSADERESKDKNRHADFESGPRENQVFGVDNRDRGEHGNYDAPGRWPANVIHDGSDEVVALFPDSDGQSGLVTGKEPSAKTNYCFGSYDGREPAIPRGDTGSAARFFYCAKADRSDRDEGLHHRGKKPLLWSSGEQSPGTFQSPNTDRAARNHHPTVKPVDLMRYLCRLVTPPCGTVLDPFCGSGSTGKAALLEGFSFIGIELDPEYAAIARDRIYAAAPLFASEVA